MVQSEVDRMVDGKLRATWMSAVQKSIKSHDRARFGLPTNNQQAGEEVLRYLQYKRLRDEWEGRTASNGVIGA